MLQSGMAQSCFAAFTVPLANLGAGRAPLDALAIPESVSAGVGRRGPVPLAVVGQVFGSELTASPILLLVSSVNHSSPLGPTAIPNGPLKSVAL